MIIGCEIRLISSVMLADSRLDAELDGLHDDPAVADHGRIGALGHAAAIRFGWPEKVAELAVDQGVVQSKRAFGSWRRRSAGDCRIASQA